MVKREGGWSKITTVFRAKKNKAWYSRTRMNFSEAISSFRVCDNPSVSVIYESFSRTLLYELENVFVFYLVFFFNFIPQKI